MQKKKLICALMVSLPLVTRSLQAMNPKEQRQSLKVQLKQFENLKTLREVGSTIRLKKQLRETYCDKSNKDHCTSHKRCTQELAKLFTLKRSLVASKIKLQETEKENALLSLKDLFPDEQKDAQEKQANSFCLIS